jgi:hypothetical protein
MALPILTVTMLGPSQSGKSTFMLGMYAILSAGLSGYFVYAKNADDDLELSDRWDALLDSGDLPPATDLDGMKTYDFVFKDGLESLVSIDWMDYRGAAIRDTSTAADAAKLHSRLVESDTVYLVLDGEKLGAWVRARRENASANADRARRQLSAVRMTRLVNEAIDMRRDRGLPAPSLLILITKVDALAAVAGTKKTEAVQLAARFMQELLPVAFIPGITALICPVQLGDFGPGAHKEIAPDSVNPLWLHKPFVFTILRYLTAEIDSSDAAMRAIETDMRTSAAEISRWDSGFWSRVWYSDKISQGRSTQQRRSQDIQAKREVLDKMRGRLGKFTEELAGLVWVVDGQMRTP